MPASVTVSFVTVPLPFALMEQVPVVLSFTKSPDVLLRAADSEKLPAPSSVTKPDAFTFAVIDGAIVPAENVPENDEVANPPVGVAACGSTNPNPTLP
jgi:hypothetical protein